MAPTFLGARTHRRLPTEVVKPWHTLAALAADFPPDAQLAAVVPMLNLLLARTPPASTHPGDNSSGRSTRPAARRPPSAVLACTRTAAAPAMTTDSGLLGDASSKVAARRSGSPSRTPTLRTAPSAAVGTPTPRCCSTSPSTTSATRTTSTPTGPCAARRRRAHLPPATAREAARLSATTIAPLSCFLFQAAGRRRRLLASGAA
jgi:hypothetical protein